MKIRYTGKTNIKQVYSRPIFLATCKKDSKKAKPTCLLQTGICHAKDDREFLQKWLLKECELHRFIATDLPDPSRSRQCILCKKERANLPRHLKKAHGGSKGLRRWYEARVMETAYRDVLLPLLRLGIWAIYPCLPNGCPLCGRKTVKKLEDGSPHKFPWRCVRFEATRNKFWSLANFGIDKSKVCVNQPDDEVWFFMLCEKKDSRRVMRFGKKLNPERE